MSVFVSLNYSEIRQSVPSAIPLSKGSFDDGPRDHVCRASKAYPILIQTCGHPQGSKIALVGSYLRVPQAAGQVEILIFLVKIIFFLYMSIIFVMQDKCLFSDISRPDPEGMWCQDPLGKSQLYIRFYGN